uniref:Transcription factor bHLH94-like isoform X2 n=1 Tax=Cymbidium goeringii TaxID=112607 RepID=A0A4Y6JKS4_9ASPA|nr:transcription factor bHLH94-like isoform X2 [Cymbidium goeringii]
MYSSGGGRSRSWEFGDLLVEEDRRQTLYWEASCSSIRQGLEQWPDVISSMPAIEVASSAALAMAQKDDAKECASIINYGQRKRRRRKSIKNKTEVENQRMTHIFVERNRRKQMNDYLAVLRSLMPSRYVQKTDQASIIGGAINFVKELEHRLQSLQVHKQLNQQQEENRVQNHSNTNPIASFFNFPQFSLTTTAPSEAAATTTLTSSELATAKTSALADIEVTMGESHANLKLLSKQRPKQLFKLVLGLQNLHLTTTHLNVITVKPMVLYSFVLKVEEDSGLTSADDIASSAHRMLEKIYEETGF